MPETLTTSVELIREGLELLHEPGETIELRAFDLPGKPKWTAAGYFDDFGKAAEEALNLSQARHVSVFQVLNPINPALLARSPNKVVDYPKETTSDADVLCRRWLFIDCDAVRPSGISSNDAELGAAIQTANDVIDWTRERFWPEPILCCSGNGGHLLYRLDMPNDAEAKQIIQRTLQALAAEVERRDVPPGTPRVKIDTSTFNASRIVPVYATWKRKGGSTTDRPHRLTRINYVPQ